MVGPAAKIAITKKLKKKEGKNKNLLLLVVLLSRSMSHKTQKQNTKTQKQNWNKQTPRRSSSIGGLDFRIWTFSSPIHDGRVDSYAWPERHPNQTSLSPRNPHVIRVILSSNHTYMSAVPRPDPPCCTYKTPKKICILKDTRNITPLLLCQRNYYYCCSTGTGATQRAKKLGGPQSIEQNACYNRAE